MNNLAVVIVACDKNAYLWDMWWHHFSKNWNIECNIYFVNEVIDISYPVNQIKVGHTPIKKWTRQLRSAVETIPEDHLFIMMDDHIVNYDISKWFYSLYVAFLEFNADALRIRTLHTGSDIVNLTYYVHGKKLKKLMPRSDYLVSFSPNIWSKDYLLRCIRKNQSPWRCETSKRMRNKGQLVLDYEIPRWYTNAIVKGEVTKDGQLKIDDYKLQT